MTRSASQPLATPLPTLLSALDRLPLAAPVRALAQDLAVVCDQEGRAVSAGQVVEAAQSELTSFSVPSGPLVSRLKPRWDRPLSDQGRREQPQALARRAKRCDRLGRLGLSAFGLSWVVILFMNVVHPVLPKIVDATLLAVTMLSFLGGLFGGSFLMIHAHDLESALARLAPCTPTHEQAERWRLSPLCQAYLSLHVREGLPLMVGDIGSLDHLAAQDAAFNERLAIDAVLKNEATA